MSERDIFFAALDLPPDERAALLADKCGTDADLRGRVEALFAALAAAGNFLAAPDVTHTFDVAAPTADPEGTRPAGPDAEAAGQVIGGRYKLVERIGEGGMGSVWLAEQTEPVRRKVALKLIRSGHDTKAVLARFEAERQALALMNHENIAKVFDGGVDGGRPYFVMELVKGVPITRFCDERRLTPQQRLELFIPVCQALHHAHQKGVIHRDIKPANVLVALYDDRPVPKVIDFGVAKATGPALTEHTLNTGFGAIVGTPAYMSPEQATFNNLDIDTRSDVYSLGVLLYELLAGSPPFAAAELKKRGLLEMLRVVREEEPPRPSTRLSTADALPSLAANRGTEPKKLAGLLRNELDWVVMKALEKDRARRYDTANGFAADVQRYLAGEPVQAHPPSTAYRLKKFVRKHKGPVTAGALLLLALSLGIAGTTFGLVRAEERRAETDQARQREKERADGERRAFDRTADVLDAMTSEITADSLSTQVTISPEQKKFLNDVLGYYREFASSHADDEKALARTARAAFRLGLIEHRLGRKQEAVHAFRRAREVCETLVANFPSETEHHRLLAIARNETGRVYSELAMWAEAEDEYRKAEEIQTHLINSAPNPAVCRQLLATIHNNLGIVFSNRKQWAEAEAEFVLARGIQKQLTDDFPDILEYQSDLARTHSNLGTFFWFRGKLPASEGELRKAVDIQSRLAAGSNGNIQHRELLARSYNTLGAVLARLGQTEAAEGEFRNSLVIRERLVSDFPGVPQYKQSLAQSHYNFACMYSELCEKNVEKMAEYAAHAIACLQTAIETGYRDVASVKQDKSLDPLRGRDDFKKLLADLEAKFPPKKETLPPPRADK